MNDIVWMQQALSLASKAADLGEVPVGALIVFEGCAIAQAYNQSIQCSDPTAHAEIKVLREAGQVLQNYRLKGCTLYVTLEPCMMCLGAMIHARIDRLIFGAFDSKAGCVTSQMQIEEQKFLNHRLQIEGGVYAEACGQILQDFFKARR